MAAGMTSSNALLARLAHPAAASARPDRAGLLRSIVANLQDVLNTRVGSAAAQMDLGTPPPNEIAAQFPASIPRLQLAIRACIERYEPRLRSVDVSFVETVRDTLVLHFQITARLAGEGCDALMFRTTVDAAGRVALQP
jgi:type VI secretion system protein